MTVSSTTLDFTPSNWDTLQEVTLTVADNDVDEQANTQRRAQIRFTPTFTGAGSDYAGYPATWFSVSVFDRDVSMTVAPLALTLKADESDNYTVTLTTAPPHRSRAGTDDVKPRSDGQPVESDLPAG